MPIIHYGFAKYLLEEFEGPLPHQLNNILDDARKSLLFICNWEGKAWVFWIDEDIDAEERAELREKIRVSTPLAWGQVLIPSTVPWWTSTS